MQSIKEIHQTLLTHAQNTNFCGLGEDQTEEAANSFIASFSKDHGLTSHTVTPLCWRFDSNTHGEISDGLIEFYPESCEFHYVDVADAKLVDSDVV